MRFPISSYRKTWKNQEICRRLLQNQEKIILSSQLTLTPILCWAKTCARDLQTVCATTKTCSGHSSKQSISIERLQHCCCCPCCNPEYKKKPCNRTLCLWAIDAGKRQTWIEHVTIRSLQLLLTKEAVKLIKWQKNYSTDFCVEKNFWLLHITSGLRTRGIFLVNPNSHDPVLIVSRVGVGFETCFSVISSESYHRPVHVVLLDVRCHGNSPRDLYHRSNFWEDERIRNKNTNEENWIITNQSPSLHYKQSITSHKTS